MAQSSIVSTDTKIELVLPAFNPLAPNFYIDIAQCLSIINRRSYRQGMNYAVAGIEVFANDGGNISFATIPTTWVADNATTKAYESWTEQRSEVLKEQPSLKAKWSDFKIFMESDHAVAGVGANITPVDFDGNAYVTGDWDMSQYVVPLPGAAQLAAGDAQEVVFHAVGDHYPAGVFDASTTSVGLIKAYAASRALVLAPDPVQQGQYITGFYNIQQSDDEKSQDIMDNVSNRNDAPPYSLSNYPGSDTNALTCQWVDTMILRNYGEITSFSSDSMGPFVAPFGLLHGRITQAEADTVYTVVIRLVPGNYKGVLAEKGV